MAKGTIATAWVQILPSLDGLQSALIKASKGAVLTPTVKVSVDSAATSKLFASTGSNASASFTKSFSQTNTVSTSLSDSLRNVASKFGFVGQQSVSAFSKPFGSFNMWNLIGAATAVTGINKIKAAVNDLNSAVIEMGNSWAQTQAMLKNAVGATGDYASAMSASLDYANETGTSVKDFVQQTARLRSLAPNSFASYEEAAKFSSLLSKNMTATGADTAEISGTLRQVTQALGKGIVNGDELNSIMENGPQIAQMLAKHLNVSTGELKNLGAAGKITGNDLRDAILENAEYINEEFNQIPITLERASNTLTNTFSVAAADAFVLINTSLAKVLTKIDTSGLPQAFANAIEDTSQMFTNLSAALQNVVDQFGPIIYRALNTGVVQKALEPLSGMFASIASNKTLVEDLANAFDTFGTMVVIGFSAALASSDSLLGRIPLIGGALVTAKNAAIQFGSQMSNVVGSSITMTGTLVSKIGDLVKSFDPMPTAPFDELNKARVELAQGLEKLVYTYQLTEDKILDYGQLTTEIMKKVTESSDLAEDSMIKDVKALIELYTEAGVRIPDSLKKTVDGYASAEAAAVEWLLEEELVEETLNEASAAITYYTDCLNNIDKYTPDNLGHAYNEIGKAVGTLHNIEIPDIFQPLVGYANVTATNLKPRLAAIRDNITSAINSNSIIQTLQASGQKISDAIAAPVKTGAAKVSSAFGSISDAAGDFVRKLAGESLEAAVSTSLSNLTHRVISVGDGFNVMKLSSTNAFKSMANAATSVAGTAIKGLGSTISAVGNGISKLGSIASSLGVTGALMTGLTTGFTTLFNLNPNAMASQFQAWQASLDKTLTDVSSKLPAMATAFSTALPGLVSSITASLPAIMSSIGQVFTTLGPTILELTPQVISAFQQIFAGLPEAIQTQGPTVIAGIGQFVGTVAMAIPGLFSTLGQTLLAAVNAAFTSLGENSTGIADFITQFTQQLSDGFTQFGAQLPAVVQNVGTQLNAALPTLLPAVVEGATNLIVSLSSTLPTLLPSLIEAASQLVIGVIEALPTILQTLLEALPALLVNVAMGIITALPTFVSAVGEMLNALVARLPSLIISVVSAIPTLLITVGSAIVSNFPSIISAVGKAIGTLVTQLPTLFLAVIAAIPAILVSIAGAFANLGGKIVDKISNIPDKVIGVFKDAGSWLLDSGAALMNGFKDGILNAVDNVKQAAKDGLQKIRDLFPFSPAKEGPFSGHGYTTYSGAALMQGFGEGITSQTGYVKKTVSDVMSQMDFTANTDSALRSSDLNAYTGTMTTLFQQKGGVTIEKVEASPLSDVELVARRFGYALDNQMIGAVRT